MIIAEIGLSHDGSLGTAHAYIDALASTGVDAIKFQTHIAEAESSKEEQVHPDPKVPGCLASVLRIELHDFGILFDSISLLN